jgi:hypothetical protein
MTTKQVQTLVTDVPVYDWDQVEHDDIARDVTFGSALAAATAIVLWWCLAASEGWAAPHVLLGAGLAVSLAVAAATLFMPLSPEVQGRRDRHVKQLLEQIDALRAVLRDEAGVEMPEGWRPTNFNENDPRFTSRLMTLCGAFSDGDRYVEVTVQERHHGWLYYVATVVS